MQRQRGFTLIELLMVISILAVLASLTIAALRSVRQDARAARTETVIQKIKAILLEKFESFENRQIPFSFQREFDNPLGEAGRPGSDRVPSAAQRQHIFKRTLMEWVRMEMPTQLEHLRPPAGYLMPPSAESQEPYNPIPPAVTIPPEDMPAYWPETAPANRNWVEIYRRQMQRRPHASYLLLAQQTVGFADDLIDLSPFDNEFYFKENNNGYNGVSLPGVNTLNGNFLATGIIESAELLYVTLYNTFDAEGRRGTHFLQPDDLGDVDKDGIPEIIDGEGFPLIFSITIQSIGQNGIAINRDAMNPPVNGVASRNLDPPDFRDQILDPRYPAEPQDYLFHVGSIGLEQYPPHLQHLKFADFSAFEL
jgi:prepilin-type N-terminal cleavage/methylation domain-containing protein